MVFVEVFYVCGSFGRVVGFIFKVVKVVGR